MKKRIFALLCAFMLILAACSPNGTDVPPTEQDADSTEAEASKQVAVFVPDAQAEYLTGTYVAVPERESLPEMLIDGLISNGAIPEDVSIIEFDDTSATLKLDLNSAYLTALGAGGSAGETMTLYAVVNTFLFNYPDASSLALTVDGKNIETEHSSYKNPFTEMQYLRE